MSSDPFILNVLGKELFELPLFHPANSAKHVVPAIDARARRVCVLGSDGSAWNMAYYYARKGIAVDWVFNKEAGEPVWMMPSKKMRETFGENASHPFIHKHNTGPGCAQVATHWNILERDIITSMKYDDDVQDLKPLTAFAFSGSRFSMLNYSTEIFSLIRNGSIVVCSNSSINRLTRDSVVLDTGRFIRTDALICYTGWHYNPGIKFCSDTQAIGDPPLHLDPNSAEDSGRVTKDTYWQKGLDSIVEQEILLKFPALRFRPSPRPDYREKFQCVSDLLSSYNYTFFRFTYAGFMTTKSSALCAQAQALWIAIYLSGGIRNDNWRYDTCLHVKFAELRAPHGTGFKVPGLAFGALPYIDMLLNDLGLSHLRKGLKCLDINTPYGPENYRGLVSEWMGKEAKRVEIERKKNQMKVEFPCLG